MANAELYLLKNDYSVCFVNSKITDISADMDFVDELIENGQLVEALRILRGVPIISYTRDKSDSLKKLIGIAESPYERCEDYLDIICRCFYYGRLDVFNELIFNFPFFLTDNSLDGHQKKNIVARFMLVQLMLATDMDSILRLLNEAEKQYPNVILPDTFDWFCGHPSILDRFLNGETTPTTLLQNFSLAASIYNKLTNTESKYHLELLRAEIAFAKGDFVTCETYLCALDTQKKVCSPMFCIALEYLTCKNNVIFNRDCAEIFSYLHSEIISKNTSLLPAVELIEAYHYTFNRKLNERIAVPNVMQHKNYNGFYQRYSNELCVFHAKLMLYSDNVYCIGFIKSRIDNVIEASSSSFLYSYGNLILCIGYNQIQDSNAHFYISRAIKYCVEKGFITPLIAFCHEIPNLTVNVETKDLLMQVSDIIDKYSIPIEKNSEIAFKLSSLTRKEYEVFWYTSKGFRNKDISDKMFISENTVKTHLKKIFKKLGITTRSDLKKILHED